MQRVLFAAVLIAACLSAAPAGAITWMGFSRFMGVGHGPGYHAGPQYRYGAHRHHVGPGYYGDAPHVYSDSAPSFVEHPTPARARQLPDTTVVESVVK